MELMNTTDTPVELTVQSKAFEDGTPIPSDYTCDGDRYAWPPLTIACAPSGTQSLALIMEDPDVPKTLMPEGLFVHWVLYNIPDAPGGEIEIDDELPGICGVNTRGEARYTGPCPPKEYEPQEHRYFFYVFALDTMLDLPEGVSKEELQRAMEGHILAEAQLVGTYKKR